MRYTSLSISDPAGLSFGNAPHPVQLPNGTVVGRGSVVPELNFTLPPMEVNATTRAEVIGQYREIVTGALERCRALHQVDVVFELETLLEMTLDPSLGTEIVATMRSLCDDAAAKEGIRATIRLTPNDTRDFDRPVRMRTSKHLDAMLELFERGAQAGGNLLSIESTGGKELHDDALMYCNVRQMVFALAVLGVRDMRFLWDHIVRIAGRTGTVAGGDTACGFANTAMVLAENRYIPRVVAAVDRIASIGRSLVAFEAGAVGPDKDCGYEGPFMKAIAGVPISMEGKTAACAHFSQVGNIAAACCDMWSNESVANQKLLSGMAPTAYLEQLVYDTRLMNGAIASNDRATLQRLFVDSDSALDPQAFILAPVNVVPIAAAYVGGVDAVDGTVAAIETALTLMRGAISGGTLHIDDREAEWIDRIEDELATIPRTESAFIEAMLPELDGGAVTLSEYGL